MRYGMRCGNDYQVGRVASTTYLYLNNACLYQPPLIGNCGWWLSRLEPYLIAGLRWGSIPRPLGDIGAPKGLRTLLPCRVSILFLARARRKYLQQTRERDFNLLVSAKVRKGFNKCPRGFFGCRKTLKNRYIELSFRGARCLRFLPLPLNFNDC